MNPGHNEHPDLTERFSCSADTIFHNTMSFTKIYVAVLSPPLVFYD